MYFYACYINIFIYSVHKESRPSPQVEQLEARLKDSAEEELRRQLAAQAEELESLKTKAHEATNDADQMRRAVETKSQELIKMVDDLAEKERLVKDTETKVAAPLALVR